MSVIVITGMIGAGKSSLTTVLADELGTTPFYESVDDNPILPLFYKDPKKYAFLLQIYFLNKRFESIKTALMNKNNVLDRSIYEDSLFFHANAELGKIGESKEDAMLIAKTYDELLQNMMDEVHSAEKKSPDLMIFVKVTYDTMIERIQKRGRDYEQDPALDEYYRHLLSKYDSFYKNYNESEKMIINGDKYDFVANNNDRVEVLSQIKNKMKSIGLLTDEVPQNALNSAEYIPTENSITDALAASGLIS